MSDSAARTAMLLFMSALATVYVLAACALVRLLLRRFGLMGAPARAVLFAERAALALAAAGLLCFAYGAFVEPYWPEVTVIELVPSLGN